MQQRNDVSRGHSGTGGDVTPNQTNLSVPETNQDKQGQTNPCELALARNHWPVAKQGESIRLLMRMSDSIRKGAFARTRGTAGRDFKMARDLAEVVEAMAVTPKEFAAAIVYHEQIVFGRERTGYKQWWPGFCKNFEAVVCEIRKGPGKTRQQMVIESAAAEYSRRQEDEKAILKQANLDRAPAHVAKRYIEKIRRQYDAS